MAISVVAELEARGVGQLDLSEALELTALVALRGAERGRRYTVRWLQRSLDETTESLADVAMVATALAALGNASHQEALASRRAITARAASR